MKSGAVTFQPHHVDHIIPPLHGGSDDATNLAWACFQCNSAKSANIASYDPKTQKLTKLYNPRTQRWARHFEMTDGRIDGLTSVGRVTVHVLQMNEPEQIEIRQRLVRRGEW